MNYELKNRWIDSALHYRNCNDVMTLLIPYHYCVRYYCSSPILNSHMMGRHSVFSVFWRDQDPNREGRKEGRKDERTNGRTDGRTDDTMKLKKAF